MSSEVLPDRFNINSDFLQVKKEFTMSKVVQRSVVAMKTSNQVYFPYSWINGNLIKFEYKDGTDVYFIPSVIKFKYVFMDVIDIDCIGCQGYCLKCCSCLNKCNHTPGHSTLCGQIRKLREWSCGVEIKTTLGDEYPQVLRTIKDRKINSGWVNYVLLVEHIQTSIPINMLKQIFDKEEIKILLFSQLEQANTSDNSKNIEIIENSDNIIIKNLSSVDKLAIINFVESCVKNINI